MPGEVTVIEHIPVELNLGQPEQIVGLASATKDLDTGQITLEIVLDGMATITLEKLVDIFEIKAIGFAGVKRRPQDGG